jgi:hypothetical protein
VLASCARKRKIVATRGGRRQLLHDDQSVDGRSGRLVLVGSLDSIEPCDDVVELLAHVPLVLTAGSHEALCRCSGKDRNEADPYEHHRYGYRPDPPWSPD